MRRVLPVVVTNGRWDYLRDAIDSYMFDFQYSYERGVVAEDPVLVYDGRESVPHDIAQFFPTITHPPHSGFDGACRGVFDVALHSAPEVTHVLHLEDDFVLERPVKVADMVDALDAAPGLAQVALLRQPVTREEAEAGGLMNVWPDEYEETMLGGVTVSRHRLFFTTNPSVYPREIARIPWPSAPGSEAKFTEELLRRDYSFAYLGRKSDPPRVRHIGNERTGSGY